MRRIFYLILILGLILHDHLISAQGLAISDNNATPDASSMLDVKSTTKGLLIPSMTTLQRNAIVAPAEGLILYNTMTNEINQRQNGAWKFLLNNDSWVGGGSGWMFNIGDNTGINTAGPSERLDVSGNIRCNSSLIIDHTSAIFQLRSAAVNKGYVQLSGDNLRLGTNSGNTTGHLVVRMNGDDLITINPQGDMNLEGKLTKPVTGNNNLLPVCYGRVTNGGFLLPTSTPNLSVVKIGTGIYEVTCSAFSASTFIVATVNSNGDGGNSPGIVAKYTTSNGPNNYRFFIEKEGYFRDEDFSFIAY